MYELQKRSPLSVILLTIVTCGIYLVYWYYKIYNELQLFSGKTPTGNPFWLDFLINLFTCGLWGIFVDYKISKQLHQIRIDHNIKGEDSSIIILILDCFSIFTLHFLWILTSAIQQDEWNHIIENVAIPMNTQENRFSKDIQEKQNNFNDPNPY
jgi:hypothetical protein